MSSQLTKSVSASTEKCESSKDFSHRFKEFRRKSGMTQPELAAHLIKSPGYISQIERGLVDPGGLLLEKFESLENSPLYNPDARTVSASDSQLLRSAPSNMPPHQEPPTGERIKKDPNLFGSSGDVDFAQCIKWLSEIHDRHPQAFRPLAAMIKGLYESLKQ
jgi:transcriptional regulator with XRE-family HTH domain